MALAVRDLYRTETELTLTPGYPPVINDQKIAEVARQAARQTVGKNGVKGQPYPSLGGEDFSFYLKHVPGCFVRFGARRDDLLHANAHSPVFDFDERVLPVGAEFLARCALLFLQQAARD
jgi:hippurate hydrolase